MTFSAEPATEIIPAVTTSRQQSARMTATHPVRAVATGFAAVFTAAGWAIGRASVLLGALFFTIGWLAGLCFDAIIVGFLTGAKIPPKPSGSVPPPGPESR